MKINYKIIPLLILAMINLVIGVIIGLYRSGWQIDFLRDDLISWHGPIMTGGFLGTVIILERAIAIRKKWAFIGVIFSGLSVIFFLLGINQLISKSLILLSSLNLIIIYLYALRIDKELHIYTQITGAFFWLIGNILWIYEYYFSHISLWWIAFLLFTISGERLELSKLKQFSNISKNIFISSILLTIISLFSTFYSFNIGSRLLGISFLIFMIWFFKYDIAINMLRNKSLTKFIAICIINGYSWLGISSIIILIKGESIIGNFFYDSFLHSFFLGFVISMIFGHAPIIFPAILRIKINYNPVFYTHLILLNISLIIRIFAGTNNLFELLKLSTMLNSITFLLFVLNTAISTRNSFSFKKGVQLEN